MSATNHTTLLVVSIVSFILAGGFGCIATVASASPKTALVLDKVRHAAGLTESGTMGWVTLRGHGEYFGAPCACEWVLGPAGEFAVTIHADAGGGWGFDGTRGWIVDATGLSRSMGAGELEATQTLAAVVSGRWACQKAGWEFVDADSRIAAAGANALGLRPANGVSVNTVEIDPSTDRPSRLSCLRHLGVEVWDFSKSCSHAGRQFPAQIQQVLPGGLTNTFEIDAVRETSQADRDQCHRPVKRCEDHRFDSAISPKIGALRSRIGMILVRPRINGLDLGPFVLDTGAAICVISSQAAKAASLAPAGRGWTNPTGGGTAAARYRVKTLSLGPLTIRGTLVTEMNLDQLSKLSGEDIAGVIGYDLFARAIVELDLNQPRIVLHDPQHYSLSEGAWRELSLYSNRPHLNCKFARTGSSSGEGIFRLDCGAPQVAAIFNFPTVERYQLLEGQTTRKVTLPLPGGPVEVAVATLGSLELAGRQFDNLRCLFVLGYGTGFSDPSCAGNLGQEVLRSFRMVFDYPHERIALLPIALSKPQTTNTPQR